MFNIYAQGIYISMKIPDSESKLRIYDILGKEKRREWDLRFQK